MSAAPGPVESQDPGPLADVAAGGDADSRDLVDWFIRRAGLARFTTFACATGFALSALTGAQAVLALAGLMTALIGSLAGVGWSHRRVRRRARVDLSCSSGGTDRAEARALPRRGSLLVVVSILMIGLFSGYLVGSLRVASLAGGSLQSRIGETVKVELCLAGQVRTGGGWQSATAVVRSLVAQRATGVSDTGMGVVDPSIGEAVLLEVPPSVDRTGDGASGDGISGSALKTSLEQGMIVVVTATVQAPDGPSDSGYDQAKQLLHQGIEVVLRAEATGGISVVGRRGGVAGWFDRLRASARDHLTRGPSDAVDEVLQGVVMGDTTGIDEDWLTAFRRSGTAHMLCVSGLHVASLAAIMIGLARLLRTRRWVGFLSASLSAVFMIPFVGASPSIVRAAIMICVVLVGRWVGRGRDQWQVLALAAAIVLAMNPYALFDVSFQLSFAAFTGILVLLGPLQRLFVRLPQAVASNVALSMAASAGTAPVALVVFGRASLVSPLANLLVVPTLPLITGMGMASVFLGFVWTGLSTALDTLASLPMMWTVQISRLMARAPVLETSDLGRAAFAFVGGLVVLPGALALAGRPLHLPFGRPLSLFGRSAGWLRAHRPRSRGRAVGLAVLIVLVGLTTGAAVYSPLVHGAEAIRITVCARGWPDEVELRVLDVGQGSALLVRTPERHTLLFDGGPAGCDLVGQLHRLGVRDLDLVVISHPHADHFAGLLEALDGLSVEAFVDHVGTVQDRSHAADAADPSSSFSGSSLDAADYLELRHELVGKGCRYVLAEIGSTITVDGVVVRLFGPTLPLVMVDGPDPWAGKGGEPSGDELNGSSLVSVVSVGSMDMIVPGDAEAGVLRRYDLPPSEAIVVPHHGSEGAVSEPLLAEWGTQAAFISAGEGNPFGHPDTSTVALLDRLVPTVFRTDTAGWISCKVDGDQMVITTERTPTR